MSGGSRGVYVCVCACAHTHSRASLHACEPIWKHILSLKCSNTHSNHSLKKSTSLVIQWREWYTVYQDTKSNPLLNKCHYLFSQFWWVNLRLHTRRIYYTRIQQQAQRGKKNQEDKKGPFQLKSSPNNRHTTQTQTIPQRRAFMKATESGRILSLPLPALCPFADSCDCWEISRGKTLMTKFRKYGSWEMSSL